MKKIRYAVVGSGWRAMFYVRIAKALPDVFEITELLCRTEEKKAKIENEYGIKVTLSEDDVIKDDPDFIVVAVNKDSIYDVSLKWMEYGYPVLCETPPAVAVDKLDHLNELSKLPEDKCPISPVTGKKAKYRLSVAEQYYMYPKHKAQIAVLNSGIIGERVSMTISHVHDYHAASLISRMLETGGEDAIVAGKKHIFPITATGNRYTVSTDGNIIDKDQSILEIEYESGKVALYDFCSDQYHSTIRTRHVLVRGIRGELCDDEVIYLDENNVAQTKYFNYDVDPSTGEYLKITFGDEVVYEPPFGKCGLTDDETAIATLLFGMRVYFDPDCKVSETDTGHAGLDKMVPYPLFDGLSDAAFSIAMHEAGDNPWNVVDVKVKQWK